VNAEWLDYSDYAEFGPDRKVVYLILQDGGFGDADGIENGIIVDPLTVGTETSVDYGSGSSNPVAAVEDIVEGILPKVGCFISTAVQKPAGGWSIWPEIRGREPAILYVLLLLGYIGKIVYSRRSIHDGKAENLSEVTWTWTWDWNLFEKDKTPVKCTQVYPPLEDAQGCSAPEK
jgi:hypothetical protein